MTIIKGWGLDGGILGHNKGTIVMGLSVSQIEDGKQDWASSCLVGEITKA